MPTSLEALQVILYLLPGYVTLRVKELLSFPNKASDIGRAIDGVVLTFLNLVVLFTLRLILPENFFSTIYATTISLFLISVLLGVVLGSDTVTSKCYGAMRYLGLTNMSGRVDAWSDAFNNIRGIYVKVTLANGKQYLGWPMYYSDDPELKDLFLADAYSLEGGEATKIAGPGVLIPGKSDLVSIEFLDPLPVKEA